MVEGRWERENVLANGVKWDSNPNMKSHWKEATLLTKIIGKQSTC